MATVRKSSTTWSNWAENQNFEGAAIEAATEESVQALVRSHARSGSGVRVAGSGHSFTPIVAPRTSLLKLTGPRGVISVDVDKAQAQIWAHTALCQIGPALWERGLSIRNQGDTDAQTIAGAAATGTKGSGARLGSISSAVVDLALVDGTGTLRNIDARTGLASDDRTGADLRAGRVGLGLLGIVTRLGLQVEASYGLAEHNSAETLNDVLDNAESELSQVRHYSLFWCPSSETSARFGLPPTPADRCWVKRLDTVPADHASVAATSGISGHPGSRIGRSYLVYPDWADNDPFIELEYMVPGNRWKEAFLSIRELMRSSYPEELSPVQVRWQAQDDSFLSAQYLRDTVSLSVVGDRDGDYDQFLRAVHEALMPFSPRPHWGKMHYFDATQVKHAFPALDEFKTVRERYDPTGVFLNSHLQGLLAIDDPRESRA